MNITHIRWAISAVVLCVLTACGGGGGDSDASSSEGANNGSGGTAGADLVVQVDPANYSGSYASEKTAVFNLLNAYRSQCGFGKLAQNSLLDQAAQNHAAYSRVGQDGHSETSGVAGFTGSTPEARITSVGYSWSSVGEILTVLVWGPGVSGNTTNDLVSVAELSATAHLKSLLNAPYHMTSAMSMNRDVGIGIHNADSGGEPSIAVKPLNINLATRQGALQQKISATTVNTFPCEGTTGVDPLFAGESPDPFPDVNRNVTPYGQPVYVMTDVGSSVTLDGVRSSITPRGGTALPTRLLTQSNDPNALLTSNEVFIVPTTRLTDNTTYDVVLHGTLSTLVSNANPTGSWSRSFTFQTGVFRGE